jgi:DNA polymerase-3 subunit gamma/tau
VVFVFATTEPHKVLQTVLYRCQRYEFRSINSLDTAGRLSQICELEAINADPETLTLISSRAGGSMRDALSLLDQLRAFAGDTVAVGDLAQLLGRMPDEVLFEAIDLISERDIGAVFVFAERLIRSGVDIREFSRALTDHLRSLFLVLHAPAAREILEVTDDGLTRLQEQANHLGSAEVLRLIDLTNEIGLQLRQAVEGRLALEVGLARMTRPDLHATPASLLARLEKLERNQGGTAESIPLPRVAPAESRAPRPEPPRAAVRLRPAPVATKPAPAAAEPPKAAPAVRPSAPAPPAPAPAAAESGESEAPPEIGAGWLWGSDDAAPARPAAAPAAKPPAQPAKAPYGEPAATDPQRAAAPATKSPAAAPPAPAPSPPAAPARDAPAPAEGTTAPVPAGELDLETIVRAWPLIRDKVKRRKISFHAVLLPAEPVAWRNGELVLEFGPRSRFHRDKVADQSQNGPLLEAFKEILGVTPRLNCVIGAEPAAQTPASDPAGTPPDDAGGPSDSDGTEPPEDAIELIRRAFKGTVVVEDP